MANEEHLRIAQQGAEAWNGWRWQNPDAVPDLKGADLSMAHLTEADLSEALLIVASLITIRLDDYVFEGWQHARKADVQAKVVGDFSGWDTDVAKYTAAFDRLLKALEAEGGVEEPSSHD
jgi:uncharacterized protein YjbI with pentapeptide repeats